MNPLVFLPHADFRSSSETCSNPPGNPLLLFIDREVIGWIDEIASSKIPIGQDMRISTANSPETAFFVQVCGYGASRKRGQMEAETAIRGDRMQKLTAVGRGISEKTTRGREDWENTGGDVLKRVAARLGSLRGGEARGAAKEIPEEGTLFQGALTVFVRGKNR